MFSGVQSAMLAESHTRACIRQRAFLGQEKINRLKEKHQLKSVGILKGLVSVKMRYIFYSPVVFCHFWFQCGTLRPYLTPSRERGNA